MADGWAIGFVRSRVLLKVDEEGSRLPTASELSSALGADRLDSWSVPAPVRTPDGADASVYGLSDDLEPPEGFRLEGLRAAYHHLSEAQFQANGSGGNPAWAPLRSGSGR